MDPFKESKPGFARFTDIMRILGKDQISMDPFPEYIIFAQFFGNEDPHSTGYYY